MVGEDVRYVRGLLEKGVIGSPCLEIGGGLPEHSLYPMLRGAGIECEVSDVVDGPNVQYRVDLDATAEQVRAAFGQKRYRSVLLLNVLEHVFEPVRILDNVMGLVAPGGVCVVVTPTVWPLHYFPLDCWRINPGFFAEYCLRRGFELPKEHFRYVSPDAEIPLDAEGHWMLPPASRSRAGLLWSRAVHRLFGTFARGVQFPSYVTTGVVIRKR